VARIGFQFDGYVGAGLTAVRAVDHAVFDSRNLAASSCALCSKLLRSSRSRSLEVSDELLQPHNLVKQPYQTKKYVSCQPRSSGDARSSASRL
jgi:hypothetical protein